MTKECDICSRPVLEQCSLCEYHAEAKHSLEWAFAAWKRAYGIGWEEYLEKVVGEENLGDWAREVVVYLIEQNDS
ncbi:hypothetical protein EU537_06315 [Candidatus Thorarchaeota archaeon]|nr:MAG: hypothetical protein EU537_06315 [Candidatus Thorarchaeota archaeon]